MWVLLTPGIRQRKETTSLCIFCIALVYFTAATTNAEAKFGQLLKIPSSAFVSYMRTFFRNQYTVELNSAFPEKQKSNILNNFIPFIEEVENLLVALAKSTQLAQQVFESYHDIIVRHSFKQ